MILGFEILSIAHFWPEILRIKKLSNPLLIIIIIELFYLHESNCKELLCTSEEVADYMDY